MVQLPVIPLVDRGSRWISGHYLDEFAENHLKDVVIREGLGAAVPSAGVACAIERGVLGRIADAAGGRPFDPACLTEDYELGLRIKRLGGRTALARVARADGGIVATREHFPRDLDAAVRQKTRWLLGIALHGWDRLGWQGSWVDRLMLLRDRKAIVAALLGIGGYGVAVLVLADAAMVGMVPVAGLFAPLVEPGSALDWTLRFTTAVLLWRLTVRAGCTTRVHGWREGVRSAPRTVISNWINALAAWRAVQRYAAIRAGRERLSSDKTAHRFPGP